MKCIPHIPQTDSWGIFCFFSVSFSSYFCKRNQGITPEVMEIINIINSQKNSKEK